MIAANDTPLVWLGAMAPDQLRAIIAHAAGLHAHHTSTDATTKTLENVIVALRSPFRAPAPPPPTMRDLAMEVAARHGLELADLAGPSRTRRTVIPRQEAFWTIYQTGRFSLTQIGRFFGGRDHGTVHHGIHKHASRLAEEQGREG